MALAYPLLALVNLLAGSFLVAAVFGFSDETATTLGFGVSIAVVVFGIAMVYAGITERENPGIVALGVATTLLATWTVIATAVFPADDAVWLVLGSALGHIVLSVAGLVGNLVAREYAQPAPRRRSGSGARRSGSKSRSRSR